MDPSQSGLRRRLRLKIAASIRLVMLGCKGIHFLWKSCAVHFAFGCLVPQQQQGIIKRQAGRTRSESYASISKSQAQLSHPLHFFPIAGSITLVVTPRVGSRIGFCRGTCGDHTQVGGCRHRHASSSAHGSRGRAAGFKNSRRPRGAHAAEKGGRTFATSEAAKQWQCRR